MKAPKCRLCGKEEWRHVCGGLPGSATRDKAEPGGVPVLEPVTARAKSVTIVTKSVTNVTEALEDERDRLLARLAEIRFELGAMTPAQRKRRGRAKPKA